MAQHSEAGKESGKSTDQARESELLAKILDDLIRIPGTNFRIGLDPIIGLLPGVGDGTTASAGMLIVFQALRRGIPRVALVRMLLNVLINVLFGAIPFVGDVFSVWFKSNRRNYNILKAHEQGNRRATVVDWIIIGGFILLLILVIIAVASLSVWIISQCVRLLSGS